MKKRNHRLLIALSTIALVGVTAVQCAWIYQGYERSKVYLEEQLNGALRSTIDDINLVEELAFIAAFSKEDSIEIRGSRQVSLVHRNRFRVSDSAEWRNKDSVIQSLTADKAIMSVLNSKDKNGVIHMEVITSNGSEEEEIRMEWKSEEALNEVMKLEEEGRLEELLKRVERENQIGSKPWNERIDSLTLHKKLSEQLIDHGISTPFEFAVVNPKGDPFDGFVSDGYSILYSGPTAKANLFPADLKSKNVFLVVYASNAIAGMLNDIGWMALLSLGFTSLMLLLFVMTIRRLMSQSRLSQLKTDFINNMSHELKTPLATISVATDSMIHPNGITNPELIKNLAHTIRKEHDRMNKHIERVLQMAESESGQFELKRDDTDLKMLVHEAVQSMEVKINESGASIELILPESAVRGCVDPLHLRSLIVNLLDNAIKYSRNHPEINVTLEDKGEDLVISIRDNGIGISESDQKAVFSRFFRVEGGNVHSVKGFGLGLSYVQMIANAHGGQISLKSKPGEGSTFTVSVPKHG